MCIVPLPSGHLEARTDFPFPMQCPDIKTIVDLQGTETAKHHEIRGGGGARKYRLGQH